MSTTALPSRPAPPLRSLQDGALIDTNHKLQPASTLVAACLLLAALLATGCHRGFYRRQADAEALALIREKSNHPGWNWDQFSMAPDPRSRLYDPYCHDCPPMPADDPYAHELMHCVDGKRGYPGWHDRGENAPPENPAWAEYLECDEQGVFELSSDDAVRVGLLNSRNYQQQLEELYLSALDVSFERFLFDSQFFAGYQGIYTADGRLRNDPARRNNAGGNSSSLFELGTNSNGPRDIAVRKAFTTGSTLVVGLANSLVWQFSGPDDYRGNTLIDFALVQPLLRGAGRDRVMERLTVSERTLLYNVRAMEQYRQAFYVQVLTGRDPGSGPNRRGGVFGSGLEGFSGVGGGFGRVQTTAATGGGNAGGGGAGAAQVGGYLGLLQNLQDIRNQEDNVKRLRNNLFRQEQLLGELRTRSGGATLVNEILRQDLQVAQARQALFNSESRLLNSRNAYEATLDNFKIILGVPPALCLNVTDNTLDPFQLIDRQTLDQQDSVEQIVARFGEIRTQISAGIMSKSAPDPVDPTRNRIVRTLTWSPALAEALQQLKAALQPVREVRERILTEFIPEAQGDVQRLAAARDSRRQWIADLKARIAQLQEDGCPLLPIPTINSEIFRVERIDENLGDVQRQLDALEAKIASGYDQHLDIREARIDQLLAEGDKLTPEKLFEELYEGVLYPKRSAEGGGSPIADVLVVLPADILALQLLQARARTDGIDLTPVDLKADEALEIARKYRRDWMNARGALVDSWRLIEFNADNLESSLDIFLNGDVSNTTDNPFRLRSATGRMRVGVQFDLPLTRLSERNSYRQALIEYQQARRAYALFEDQVARGLRGSLRTILTNQVNFELQRLAVLEAARQIDRNEDIRIDQELTGASTGVTAARDSVSALNDLLDAQNNFTSIYVNYEALRRSLDLDLGTIQLDSEGIWIDPGKITAEYGAIDPWLRVQGFGEACETSPFTTEGELPPPAMLDDQPELLPAQPLGPPVGP